MGIEGLKKFRELARKLVTAGADLHYRNRCRKTLLQSLLSSSSLQMTYDLISEWLLFLAGCNIHTGNYALQENSISGGEPFEVDIGRTVKADRIGRHSYVPIYDYYACVDPSAAKFEFDDTGNPIPKILRGRILKARPL
jgi:hypothetical protein